MNKKDKIIILKAKVIKLKEQLKSARLELADRDNEKHKTTAPIESTQELFEGKGYVYELVNGVKFYRTEIGYSTDKTTAIEFKSLESYFEKYQHTDKDKFHFEPIGTVKAQAHY